MKKHTVFISIIFCFLFACEKNDSYVDRNISACGVTNPQKNVKWLKELIDKAETDKTGNYTGTIWLEEYKGEDVFVVTMGLGSGGVAFYVFNCKGESVKLENPVEFNNNRKNNKVVYSNLPYPFG